VAVLGWEAARELFDPPESAVGRTLRVNGAPFELVGVFDEKSGRQYTNTNRPDNRLLVVPVTSAEARLGFAPEQDRVFVVYPREGMRGPGVFRAVAASLARRGGFHPDDEDALRHFDLTALLGLLDLVHQGFSLFVGVAGTLTLLVGAVGIANYQLALLAERAVEIAVARALGARGRTLALQCALEAALLAGAASLLGVGFGIAACAGLAALAPAGLFPVPVLSARVAVVTAGALVLVALVAALVPALRVRRMEVALALRAST
jgi:putative ABC transport system permease protein